MHLTRGALCAVLALLISACATSPIPMGYSGPTSTILDFATKETQRRWAYFYVAEFNGNLIESARTASQSERTFVAAVQFRRVVPSGRATIKLSATTAYDAPIYEIVMATSMRSATSTIVVDLAPGKEYQVNGTLSEGHDEVWLEDRWTHERVGALVSSSKK